MPITLTTEAIEGSTYSIPITFTDTTATEVAPNSDLTWTLTDVVGNVINSRSGVSITPATTVTVVLHGDDLAVSDAYRDNRRLVTFQCTYNSSIGTNLEFVEWAEFTIIPSPVVT